MHKRPEKRGDIKQRQADYKKPQLPSKPFDPPKQTSTDLNKIQPQTAAANYQNLLNIIWHNRTPAQRVILLAMVCSVIAAIYFASRERKVLLTSLPPAYPPQHSHTPAMQRAIPPAPSHESKPPNQINAQEEFAPGDTGSDLPPETLALIPEVLRAGPDMNVVYQSYRNATRNTATTIGKHHSLFTPYHGSTLAEAIEALEIKYLPYSNQYKDIAPDEEKYLIKVRLLIRTIKEVLPNSLKSSLLLDIITNPTFQLWILPADETFSQAITIPHRNAICIAIEKDDYLAKSYVRYLVENEMHALSITVRNFQRSPFPRLTVQSAQNLPVIFTDNELNIDATKQKKLMDIFEDGIAKIEAFEPTFVASIKHLVKFYKPYIYRFEMPEEEFKRVFQHQHSNIYYSLMRKLSVRILSQKKLSTGQLACVMTVALDHSYEQKLKALRDDVANIIYKHLPPTGRYKKMPLKFNVAELGSTLYAAYPHAFLAKVFPGFCEMLNEFYRIKDYCIDPNHAASPPTILHHPS